MIKEFEQIVSLGTILATEIKNHYCNSLARKHMGKSVGGDINFEIDDFAENRLFEIMADMGLNYSCFTEKNGLNAKRDSPYILIIDPIDGSRGAVNQFECCCVSIAVSRNRKNVTIDDVIFGALIEIASGNVLFAEKGQGVRGVGISHKSPDRSNITDLTKLFWSVEICGTPVQIINKYLRQLIDSTSVSGGVFVFNSASYSISRVVTGQLDAYVAIANRIAKEMPYTKKI